MLDAFIKKKKNGRIYNKLEVSLGAAKQPAILSGESNPQTVSLSEVSSLSLGVNIAKKGLGSGFMSIIIPRNTTIPSKKSGNYTTVFDNQTSANVEVYEGEHEMVKDNHLLDKFELNGIASAPAGVPKLEYTMEIDKNGILNVTARDKDSGSESSITIEYYRKKLSPEDIERMIKEVEQICQNESKSK